MRYSNVFICFLVDKGSINKVTIGGWGVIQNAYRGRGNYGKHSHEIVEKCLLKLNARVASRIAERFKT